MEAHLDGCATDTLAHPRSPDRGAAPQKRGAGRRVAQWLRTLFGTLTGGVRVAVGRGSEADGAGSRSRTAWECAWEAAPSWRLLVFFCLAPSCHPPALAGARRWPLDSPRYRRQAPGSLALRCVALRCFAGLPAGLPELRCSLVGGRLRAPRTGGLCTADSGRPVGQSTHAAPSASCTPRAARATHLR